MNKTEKYYENAEEWIKDLMNNSEYPYIITKEENKFLLLVKITGKQHLKIPVYFTSYQKDAPIILETIQQYANIYNNSLIEMLVKNSPEISRWSNQKINRRRRISDTKSINEIIREKLVIFLNKELKKILDETRDDNSIFNKSRIETEKRFRIFRFHDGIKHCKGYEFSKKNNPYYCYLFFKGEENREFIRMEIDHFSSHDLHGTIGGLYRCMDKIEEITKEFRKLRSDLEKQEKILLEQEKILFETQKKQKKINEISRNSIETWTKAIMSNQQYLYYFAERKNKITLSIKMENNMQLDIPIYYNRFQTIIPELSKTVQQFENTVNNSKIFVFFGNNKPNQQWINQK